MLLSSNWRDINSYLQNMTANENETIFMKMRVSIGKGTGWLGLGRVTCKVWGSGHVLHTCLGLWVRPRE